MLFQARVSDWNWVIDLDSSRKKFRIRDFNRDVIKRTVADETHVAGEAIISYWIWITRLLTWEAWKWDWDFVGGVEL